MQDTSISFWREDVGSDMIAKVMDLCSTDPSGPSHCESPRDIKIARNRLQVMEKLTGKPLKDQSALMGDQYPEKAWWSIYTNPLLQSQLIADTNS